MKREECIYMAKICEQTERFDEMLEFMKRVLSFPDKLSIEERNLLSVAYKNSVGSRRTAWRVISSLEQKEETKANPSLPLLKEFKVKIESELDKTCEEIIRLLDEKLIKSSEGEAISEVFYQKMRGDYYRYIAEYQTGDKHKNAAEQAFQSYMKATEIANKKLDTTNPTRLGLALNYSVYYYEVKNDAKQACQLAKQAFDDAIADIEKIPEEDYKDSTTIMQLIRDNLTLWTQELEQEEGDEKDK